MHTTQNTHTHAHTHTHTHTHTHANITDIRGFGVSTICHSSLVNDFHSFRLCVYTRTEHTTHTHSRTRIHAHTHKYHTTIQRMARPVLNHSFISDTHVRVYINIHNTSLFHTHTYTHTLSLSRARAHARAHTHSHAHII